MDNNNPNLEPTPNGGPNPSMNLTRTLAGILVGAVLAGGVLIGAFWAIERSSNPSTTVTEPATEFEADKARVTLWFADTVRSIGTTIELFRIIGPDDISDDVKFVKLCTSFGTALEQLELSSEAPEPTLEKVFRDWVKTLGLMRDACDANDKDEFERLLGVSDSDFRRFDTAVTPFLPPAPNTPLPAPEAVPAG
jgi:hypothetical protein